MNRRDQELLEKQLHGLTVAPPANGAVMLLTIIVVFLAGLTIGEFWSAATSHAPMQVVASNDTGMSSQPPSQAPQTHFWQ